MKKLLWILLIAGGVCFVAFFLPRLIEKEEDKQEGRAVELQEQVHERTVKPMERARRFSEEAHSRSADKIEEIEKLE